ncbi:protein lifeguard 1 isoform X4 [Salmo salar]|uniref:Protein lifeguard 1 isoform X4 n=1 Tax=Salmo salar TaxID=8030 RepID=A0ABM3CUK5_SALSA|nr:protein lifeguard 1 isoform X4 [Salmo salar]
MTDAQNYPMPTESKEVLNSNLPPPYPHGETQVDSMPPYMPPPYSAAPAMYPPSPYPPVLYPPQAGVDMGTLPPGECNPLGEPGSSSPEADAALLVSSFDDKTIRKAFIRKVFSVVTLQLLVTFSIVCVFTFSSVVRAAVQSNIWIYLSSYILFAVVAISLSYSNSFSRSHPWNLVGLIVYGSLGALLFSLFLAIDCQLVMGRQKYALDPEEYVFAALILYLDIINIFLYLLIIMGGSSK